MALKQFVKTTVDQPGYDESKDASAVTCFGLPGYGGLRPSMSSCHFEVKVAVYDDESVYVGINGRISDPVSAAPDYASRMVISPKAFTWVNGAQSSGKTYKNATIDASDGSASRAPTWASGKTAYQASFNANPDLNYGWFIWDMGCPDATDVKPTEGYIYVGQLSEFGASSDGKDGVVYVGGTGTYVVNDPVYPTPVQVRVPGFVTPAVSVDYYPFSIRKSGAFASADRTGGFTGIRENGAWRAVKNNDSGTKVQGYVRQGGKWVKAPKFT